MSTWYPGAVRKPIPRNFGGKRRSTRAVVLHVDAGAAKSLQGWFSNPASGASSHFYVTYDGTVEQYVDADLIAWTQRAGNTTCVAIETQGLGAGRWTPAQAAAIAALTRWLCETYGLPKTSMVTARPAARGIGMHRFGIDPYRASGTEIWGPRGKVCPGNDRVAQFPEVVAAVAGGSGGVTPAPAPAPGLTEAQKIAQMNAGYSVAWIKAIQEKLNRLGHGLETDGVRGAKTIASVAAFQRQHGLVPDGLPGVATNAKLDAVLAPKGVAWSAAQTIGVQAAVRAVRDGIWGADTTKRCDTVREASRWGGRDFPYGVAYAQRVVGARADGVWGPLSDKAHDATVANLQRALNLPVNGIWDDNCESRYKAALAAARS